MKSDVSSQSTSLPIIIAHRGASGYAPENTESAFNEAHKRGALWVELDTKLTADGAVVIFHDDDLDRTSNGTGPLADRTLAQLKELDSGGYFDPSFAGAKIITLQELIAILADHSMGANVEIKPNQGQEIQTTRAVCEILNEHWPDTLPAPVLSSFKSECLVEAMTYAPHISRALLLDEVPANWLDQAKACAATSIHVWNEPLTQEQVQSMISAGYSVRCYTVDDPDEAAKVLSWGVESIFTNFPDRFKALSR